MDFSMYPGFHFCFYGRRLEESPDLADCAAPLSCEPIPRSFRCVRHARAGNSGAAGFAQKFARLFRVRGHPGLFRLPAVTECSDEFGFPIQSCRRVCADEPSSLSGGPSDVEIARFENEVGGGRILRLSLSDGRHP